MENRVESLKSVSARAHSTDSRIEVMIQEWLKTILTVRNLQNSPNQSAYKPHTAQPAHNETKTTTITRTGCLHAVF